MDLISREDVKKQLDFNLKYMEKQYHTILRCIYRQIADLPAVESRSKGRWLNKRIRNIKDFGECSICGWQQQLLSNYCPKCGAEMESEI